MENKTFTTAEIYQQAVKQVADMYYDALTTLLKNALESFFETNPEVQCVLLMCGPNYYNDHEFNLLGVDIYDGTSTINYDEDERGAAAYKIFAELPNEYYTKKFGSNAFRLTVNRHLEIAVNNYND